MSFEPISIRSSTGNFRGGRQTLIHTGPHELDPPSATRTVTSRGGAALAKRTAFSRPRRVHKRVRIGH